MITYTVKVNEFKTKCWYLNGKLHREDGPAVEHASGTKDWYLNGKRHREDGPAIEWASGTKEWYLNGDLHREDGPAIEWAGGAKSWWLNNEKLTEAEFNSKMKKTIVLDTPRTDAAFYKIDRNEWIQVVDAEFARELERELAEAKQEACRKDGVKWSDVSESWRHKFEAVERALAELQKKSAREVFARGAYAPTKGTGSMPQQFAPQWWYDCFNKGYHDMSIFEIEWGYDAYLKHHNTKL